MEMLSCYLQANPTGELFLIHPVVCQIDNYSLDIAYPNPKIMGVRIILNPYGLAIGPCSIRISSVREFNFKR